MPDYILPAIAFLMIIAALVSYRPSAVTRKFKMTDDFNNPATAERTRVYRKSLYAVVIVLAALIAPLYLLHVLVPDYLSFALLYFFLWVTAWVYLLEFKIVPSYLRDVWQMAKGERAGKGAQPRFINRKWKLGIPLVVLVLTGSLSMVFYFEFSRMTIDFEGDEVSIHAPIYSCEFSRDDIVSVVKVQWLPRGTKINGFATSKNAYGYFDLDGIGKTELFVNHHNRPYIMVTLKDKVVFLNGETAEETDAYYHELKKP